MHHHPSVTPAQLTLLMKDCETSEDATVWVRRFRQEFTNVHSLLQGLCVHPLNGIESDSVQLRRDMYGDNRDKNHPNRTVTSYFFQNIWEDKMGMCLLGFAFISMTLGLVIDSDSGTSWLSDFFVIAVWLGSSIWRAANCAQQERDAHELKARNEQLRLVTLIRDGQVVSLPVNQIVIGDIVVLEAGSSIPADGIFLRAHELKCDESCLTGESETVNKRTLEELLLAVDNQPLTSPKIFAFKGCNVASGSGHILVTRIGQNTLYGNIMLHLIDDDQLDNTRFSCNLTEFAEDLFKYVVPAAGVIGILHLGFFIYDYFTGTSNWNKVHTRSLLHCFYFPLALFIGVMEAIAVISDLLRMVTAWSVVQCLQANALIKHVSAIENLACVDKLVIERETYIRDSKIEVKFVKGHNNTFESSAMLAEHASSGAWKQVLTAFRVMVASPDSQTAINQAFNTFISPQADALREIAAETKVLAKYSSKKGFWTAWIVRNEDGCLIFKKGNTIDVLTDCSKILNLKTNITESLTLDQKERLEDTGPILRAVRVAFKEISESEGRSLLQDLEKLEEQNVDFTYLFTVVLDTSALPEAKMLLHRLRDLGMDTVIVTGDMGQRLLSQLAELGSTYLGQENLAQVVIDGPDLVNHPQPEVPLLRGLGRSTPQQRYKLVKQLQDEGETVGVIAVSRSMAPAMLQSGFGITVSDENQAQDELKSDVHMLTNSPNSLLSCIAISRAAVKTAKKSAMLLFMTSMIPLVSAAIQAVFFRGALVTPSTIFYIYFIWIHVLKFAAFMGREDQLIREAVSLQMVPQNLWKNQLLVFLSFCGIALLVISNWSLDSGAPLHGIITLQVAYIATTLKLEGNLLNSNVAGVLGLGLLGHILLMRMFNTLFDIASPSPSLSTLWLCLCAVPLTALVVWKQQSYST